MIRLHLPELNKLILCSCCHLIYLYFKLETGDKILPPLLYITLFCLLKEREYQWKNSYTAYKADNNQWPSKFCKVSKF